MTTLSVSRNTGIPIAGLVRACRPRQFIKNGIVFVAFVFTINLHPGWRPTHPDEWLPLISRSFLAFATFCMVCGAEYLINDVRDIESDRQHPTKRFRAIASGEVSPRAAQVTAICMFGLGFSAGLTLGWHFSLALGAYGVIMLGYSYVLKHVVLIDVLTIAIGFVLRAMAGGFAINVPISPWLYLCTLLGALFLAVSKRRHELLLVQAGTTEIRPILSEYTTELLDQMSATVTASTVIAYSFYTFTAENLPKNHAMMATIPFVMYGIFRYLYLVYRRDEGGAPDEMVTRDKPLLACVVLWMAAAGVVLAMYR